MASRVVLFLRSAALVSIASGLIGGYVWSLDLVDRADGDDLRWGFWHNPFMGFTPFNEAFLDISMWVLLGCSAAAGLGGLLLLAPSRKGVALVTWQARVSIIVNSVVVIAIALAAFGYTTMQWKGEALALRLGAVVVDLGLWAFLSSGVVRAFFDGRGARRLASR